MTESTKHEAERSSLDRCECRGTSGLCSGATHQHGETMDGGCLNDAVRVIYREPDREAVTAEEIPMCAACAEYHEAKGEPR